MYYIYDNYHDEWYDIAFETKEDAEMKMNHLILKCKRKGLSYDFDIYQKIT